MPRVEVNIRVLNDDRSTLAQSTFQVGTEETGLLMHGLTPQDLAQDLGSNFRDDTTRRLRTIGSGVMPGDMPVTQARSPREIVQETLRRHITSLILQPISPETRAELLQELEDFWGGVPQTLPQ